VEEVVRDVDVSGIPQRPGWQKVVQLRGAGWCYTRWIRWRGRTAEVVGGRAALRYLSKDPEYIKARREARAGCALAAGQFLVFSWVAAFVCFWTAFG